LQIKYIIEEGESKLECSNCGKSDKLHDEGDTVYCSHCAQRTLKSSGEIYLTKCPECGEMTRGGAAYCELCMGWKGE
jgi:ribosomal protein S27AE